MTMTRISVFCIFLLVVAGCAKKSDRLSENLLPQDSVISETLMIQILADVHILEAGIQMKKNRGIHTGAVAEQLYNGLFAKYRITESRYRKNLEYYQRNTAAFEKLYQKVIAEIDSRKSFVPAATPVKEE